MERYFPPGRTDLVVFPLEHISHQEWLLEKNAEGSLWSGSLKCRKLLHIEKFNTYSEFNSSLIFMTHRKFGTTRPQFSRKSDPNVFVSSFDRSFCIQCSVDSKDSPPSCSFSRLKGASAVGASWRYVAANNDNITNFTRQGKRNI